MVEGFTYPGFADDSYVIPWGKLRHDTRLGGYRTDITEDELHDAPRVVTPGEGDEPLGRNQEEELHAYFRVPPYWRAL